MDLVDHLGQEVDQILDDQVQRMQHIQQLLHQPGLQPNDHLMELHQQLQHLQQLQPLPHQQAQQVLLPQPQPQQQQPVAAPAAAAAAQHMPQFHLHMMPAGIMEGFAAIPVVGFAPFQPGQFAPPLRRRFALARRGAAAAAPAAALAHQPADPLAQFAAVAEDAVLVQRPRHADQLDPLAPLQADADAGNVAVAPEPMQHEQQQQHAIRVQLLVGGQQPAVRDPHPEVGAHEQQAPVVLEDPEEIAANMLFEDDILFRPFRGEMGEEEVAESRRDIGGERTPPREVPARIEDPNTQEMNASCPICILPFKNGADGSRVARVLACGHLICNGCVKQFCRNLKDNSSMVYHSYDRAPCVVCQRPVRWRGLPECKTVGYLYEQLELTNEERNPVDGTAKIRSDTRKKAYRYLDNLSSSCHEIATKIRKLVRRADGVYDQSLEMSSHSVGRETMSHVETSIQADWLIGKVEEETNRVLTLEKHFNEHYEKMNQILEEIASKPFTLPKDFPKQSLPSTSG